MARIFRDEDYRPRPNRRGSRPRTKHRPSHESAVDGLVTAVDRGRYRVVLADADGDFDADGRTVTAEVEGFHAGVVQHENDHLDGILYPMRMTDFGLMGFNEEIARFSDQPGAAPPPAPR